MDMRTLTCSKSASVGSVMTGFLAVVGAELVFENDFIEQAFFAVRERERFVRFFDRMKFSVNECSDDTLRKLWFAVFFHTLCHSYAFLNAVFSPRAPSQRYHECLP